MIQIVKFNIDDKENVKMAFDIREAVFVREQQVDPKLEHDKYENVSHHYLAYNKNDAVGTARWRQTKDGVKLERFAVIRNYRGQGIGAMLLKSVLDDVLLLNCMIYLHAQVDAVSFYEKNGFIKQGDMFQEAGINHYKMIYNPTSI